MILPENHPDAMQVRADMRHWLDAAVIGLNLCPFAKAVVARGQLHWAVSDASDAPALLQDLAEEAQSLLALPAEQRDTTLLVAPDALPGFLDFLDAVQRAERWVRKRGLDGVLQVASFHPAFEFADEAPDALGHRTNRAPYPTLHLLREDSIARALESFPDPASIYERNLATLARLGTAGWDALGLGRSVQRLAPGPGTPGASSREEA